MQLPSETLYFQSGNSDKVYQTQVAVNDGGYVVNFQYGRRGAALRDGTKTPRPVPLDRAIEVHRKLVASKVADGYTPVEGGTAYQATEHAGRVTGLVPQLLNAIDDAEAERLLDDDNYVAQQKVNGERRGVILEGGKVLGSNKLGLEVGLPVSVASAVLALAAARGHALLKLDGEIVGETLHLFDVLQIDNVDFVQRQCGVAHRLDELEGLFSMLPAEHRAALSLVGTARTSEDKRALLAAVGGACQEGVVFKKHDAPYVAGRPASGGDQLKFKLWESATLIAGDTREGKRSIALFALGTDGERLPFGHVTVPSNHDVPEPGALVEVRYLYAFDGALHQPTYLGKRTDQTLQSCDVSQLKFAAAHVSVPATQDEANDERPRPALRG